MNVRNWLSALALTAGAAAFCSSASAQVTGKVTLDGKAPEMPVIDMSGVPQCAAQHAGQTVTEQTVVVGKDNGLANVVVSITIPDGVTAPDVEKKGATLDQKGCMYSPHVIAIQKGEKLYIQNSDPFLHNVHSQSENAPFNFAQPMVGKKAAPALKDAEYFHVKCDVHPWMSAWIAVLDNGYFGVTKDDGSFEIPKGLPDGDYKVTAWHEKYDKQDGTVTVKDGKGTVDFKFKAE
jgi:plastocyanin